MGFLRKIGRKIKKAFKKIGKKIKRAFGKVMKFFGKLGPLGSIALSFLLPGIGSALSGWFSGLPAGNFIKVIGEKMLTGAKWVKGKVGAVFNKVTDAIEYGMNAVSKPFMKTGARGAGSAFRDFVSDITGGFIDPSEKGNIFDKELGLRTNDGRLVSELDRKELSALGEDELTRLRQQAAAPRAKASFIKDNMRTVKDKEGFTDADLNLKKDEVYGGYNEATGQHEVWKDTDAFIKSRSGELDVDIYKPTTDASRIVEGTVDPKNLKLQEGEYYRFNETTGQHEIWKSEEAYNTWVKKGTGSPRISSPAGEEYSVLSGKPEDMSTREYISGSREWDTYKKIGPLQTAGTAMLQEEYMYESYLDQKKDYYTDLALQSAEQYSDRNQYGNAPRYPGVTFVDPADFQIGQDLNEQYLASMNYAFDPRQAQINAFDIGGYGFNFQDYVEAADARYGT